MKLRAMTYALAIASSCAMANTAKAQEASKPLATMAGDFGGSATLQCFELVDEGQQPLCWLYSEKAHSIGFYRPDGEGPMMFWPLDPDVEFRDLSVSDDGRYAVIILDNLVEIYTLELRRPSRLAGISTPRTFKRLIVSDALTASIAGNNILVVFEDRIERFEMRTRIFLPALSAWRPSTEDEPTPEHGPVVPTRTPQGPMCTGRSDDPPECARLTPPPAGPPETPEPVDTPVVLP